MVVYNAGTDVLIGDSLGQLDITPEVSVACINVRMHVHVHVHALTCRE